VGDAFTFVAPEEEGELRAIERAIGARLPRVTLPDFDYRAKPQGKLEIPIGERIAAIRARKADERGRSKAKAQRRTPSAAPRAHQAPSHPGARPGGEPPRRFRPRQTARRRRP
jgi:ATP-dependent RNA helicase RhlE